MSARSDDPAAERPPIEWLDDRRRTRDLLDLQEGTGPVPLLDAAAAVAALRAARRIAVVGASVVPSRPSNGVLRTLIASGYDCVPVNPTVAEVLGMRSWPSLEAAVAATGPVDLVDVFRRSEYTPDIARSAVAVGARVLWLQLGVVSWEAADIAHTGGLGVVMDRCTAIELRGWRVGDP
jgi:predicted CoA-binding protein